VCVCDGESWFRNEFCYELTLTRCSPKEFQFSVDVDHVVVFSYSLAHTLMLYIVFYVLYLMYCALGDLSQPIYRIG
jgi:hypothetical protein